jgi:transposase InsO family protein
MQVRRLFRDIQRGENDLDTMRRSQNWSRYRYHALVQLLKANDIPIPWSDYRFPDDFSKEERLPEVEPPSFTPLEQTKRDVMHDLERNCHQAPSRHRYSEATKTFAFAVNVFSNACYRLMREVIDLPSNRTLQDSFNAAVGAIDEA